MSLLVLGISHHSAPVEVLDAVALTHERADAVLTALLAHDEVAECAVLATCNRVELYAEVSSFHPAVEAMTAVLLRHSGLSLEALRAHLFVQYADRTAEHLFTVASGLDSMAVGEAQVRGQVREALHRAEGLGGAGPSLHALFAAALRAGKRVQHEAAVDRVAPSLADRGLDLLADDGAPATGARVVVLGAGSMASVAVAALQRRSPSSVVLLSRDEQRGRRLAEAAQVRWAPADELVDHLVACDLLLACTGAQGFLVGPGTLEAAGLLGDPGAPVILGVLDLALPRDVDPAIAELPGVSLRGLADIAEHTGADSGALDGSPSIRRAQEILAAEVAEFVEQQRVGQIAPTVVALREMAEDIVQAEVDRLFARLPALQERERAEVAAAIRRVARKLLHAPTVRVKTPAGPAGEGYERALRHLFALDPGALEPASKAVAGE